MILAIIVRAQGKSIGKGQSHSMNQDPIQEQQKVHLSTVSGTDLEEVLECICQLEQEIKALVFEGYIDENSPFRTGGGNRIRTGE